MSTKNYILISTNISFSNEKRYFIPKTIGHSIKALHLFVIIICININSSHFVVYHLNVHTILLIVQFIYDISLYGVLVAFLVLLPTNFM